MRINDTHYRSSAASLLWAAFFVAVMLVSAINYILIFSDRIENNPYRTKDALLTMVCWLPILTIVLTIGSMLVFALPVLFQCILIRKASRQLPLDALISTVLASPITAVLTWYCYDKRLGQMTAPYLETNRTPWGVADQFCWGEKPVKTHPLITDLIAEMYSIRHPV